jgi:putative transposase
VILRTRFEYPPEIYKAIYTTNAVESLNSLMRTATKRPKLFPNDDSAHIMIYLTIEQGVKKWTLPIQKWRMALNRFVIEFGDQLPDHP